MWRLQQSVVKHTSFEPEEKKNVSMLDQNYEILFKLSATVRNTAPHSSYGGTARVEYLK